VIRGFLRKGRWDRVWLDSDNFRGRPAGLAAAGPPGRPRADLAVLSPLGSGRDVRTDLAGGFARGVLPLGLSLAAEAVENASAKMIITGRIALNENLFLAINMATRSLNILSWSLRPITLYIMYASRAKCQAFFAFLYYFFIFYAFILNLLFIIYLGR